MSKELWYWIVLGVICVIPFVVGVYLMSRTQKIGISFWISIVLSAVITAVSCLWWEWVNEDPFTIRLGIVFYAIAWVNVGVLEIFALLSMRKINHSERG